MAGTAASNVVAGYRTEVGGCGCGDNRGELLVVDDGGVGGGSGRVWSDGWVPSVGDG